MSKKTFVDELYVVPDSLQNRVLGTFPTIPVPTTESEAVIAMGVLSANLNNALFAPLEGLDLVELLLRVGQRNSTSIAMLLSSLEVIAATSDGLTIISPQEGAEIGLGAQFACSGVGIQSVTVTIEGAMEFDLTLDGDIWSGTLTDSLAAGEYSATFTATLADESTLSASVSFSIVESSIIVASIPRADTSYFLDDLPQVSVTLRDDAAAEQTSLRAEIFGTTLTLIKSGATFAADVGAIGLDYVGLNVMTVYDTVNKVIGTVNFVIGTADEGEPD